VPQPLLPRLTIAGLVAGVVLYGLPFPSSTGGRPGCPKTSSAPRSRESGGVGAGRGRVPVVPL